MRLRISQSAADKEARLSEPVGTPLASAFASPRVRFVVPLAGRSAARRSQAVLDAIVLPGAPAILLVVALLGPEFAAGDIPAGSDIITFFYQVGLQIRAAVSHGTLPFWNPYQFAGTPFLADPS